MSKSSIRWQKLNMVRIVLSIFFLAMGIYMLVVASNFVTINSNITGKEITPSDYNNLLLGETVHGTLTDIIMEYDGNNEEMNYYLVKSDDNMLLTFRTVSGSNFDRQVKEVLQGTRAEVDFRGQVSTLNTSSIGSLKLNMIADQTLKKNGIKGSIKEHLILQAVDINSGFIEIPVKAIICTFVGAAVMFLIAFLLLKKPIKNIIYCIKETKGQISFETEFDPSIKLKAEEYYTDGPNEQGYFYVGYEQEKISEKGNDKDENIDVDSK